MPSNHLTLRRPLLFLPTIFPSIMVFSNELVLRIRWPKYWSFSFSISHSNEYSRLISFRIDWLDLLAVQETLKSLLQHHSSKASILQCSAFFIVQLSRVYMTTGKTTALTRQAFVGKVTSLLFNTLSRFVIAFLPRSKRLLTWGLNGILFFSGYYTFSFGCARSLLLSRLSLVGTSWGYSLVAVLGLPTGWLLLLWSTGLWA